MKPLLIIPPAPARWPGLRELPIHDHPLWWDDLQKRFAEGLPGTQDAFALIVDGGLVLACAGLCKRHDLGVLSRVFTRPEHRRRGFCRMLLEALIGWFDMSGGKWLYATTTADLAEVCFRKLSFHTIRRAPRTPHDAVVLLRAVAGVPVDPLSTARGNVAIHDVARANWPTVATLLFNRPGPDPRVPLDESAVQAELTALELLDQQEKGVCQLKAAFHGPRLVALASLATNVTGDRTYAMITPHQDAPAALREAVVALARAKGYQHVDFPMEALAPTGEALRVPPAPASVPPAPGESGAATSVESRTAL